jgi:hypothetical protein
MAIVLDRREVAWAAGLFEGEGCITSNGKRTKLLPTLVLCTADLDVLQRFHGAVGGVGKIYPRKMATQFKAQWEWRATGHRRAQHILALLWHGLGARRRTRAAQILTAARG